jgi:hypothetical protein
MKFSTAWCSLVSSFFTLFINLWNSVCSGTNEFCFSCHQLYSSPFVGSLLSYIFQYFREHNPQSEERMAIRRGMER